jgi:hypothetical protein
MVGSRGCGLKIMPAKKPFPRLELLRWPSVPRPWDVWEGAGQIMGLNLMLQGANRLLHGGNAVDTLQSLVYLAHPIGGGC